MKTYPVVCAIGVLIFVGLSLPASPGYTQIYKWEDEKGTIWFTDDPNAMPEESRGQLEKVMKVDEVPELPSQNEALQRSALEPEKTSSAESDLKQEQRRRDERSKLEEEISTLEANLSAGRRALERVPLTDRRGYWYVIQPATGTKVLATYKDPGAIWSNATWPALPTSARTKESDERWRIQSDIAKFEKDLNRAKEESARLSRQP